MNEVLQVTVEQLLLQQKLRDEDIQFLKNENVKLNAELKTSRIIQNNLVNNLKAIATISFN
jgi:hypothetical protein